MEKESENNKPTIDEGALAGDSNHPTKPDTSETTEPLYYTKDGRTQFGITPPSAFALSYPYPPLPSNLAKNRVLRATDEQTKENLHEGITEAEKEFEKEAMPLPSLTIQGLPLPKVLIPEIELALYWDRHPYEFRVPEKGQSTQLPPPEKSLDNKNNHISDIALRRSKSEMNLASKVGKVLEEHNSFAGNSNNSSNSRRSSVSASNKTIRSATVTSASSLKNFADESNDLLSVKNNHYEEHLAFSPSGNCSNRITNGNRCTNGKCGSGSGNGSRKSSANKGNHAVGDDSTGRKINSAENGKHYHPVAKNNATENANQPMHMSESERRKFEDIKLFHHQNDRQSQGHSRPKLIRSQEQVENRLKKSAGVQVTIDDVTAAALKSTYLCPLHGQYRRGIERRDNGGFRTDMGSVNNVHAHCSRALKGKPSRTKMIKTTETQTDGEFGSNQFQSLDDRTNKRSKTAGHARNSHKGKEIMASEYHGSFRDPYKIAAAEKRYLRNKILNYCFTKHSIF